MLARFLADDPDIQVVYVRAIRPDSYYVSVEDGRTVIFVHPVHQSTARRPD
ncbi:MULTISPECIES: hypothetical protein [Aeromicrobium]|uniref:hypothetical protein n=1 Tax=Aeromicrobium TaxID=2040 RepID=UPI000A536060|nr:MULTISPECIES: hypothetical protein [Aeromicrobium]MCL8249812.1 hypothetical protein [Aeromicrobium fastidiosum]